MEAPIIDILLKLSHSPGASSPHSKGNNPMHGRLGVISAIIDDEQGVFF